MILFIAREREVERKARLSFCCKLVETVIGKVPAIEKERFCVLIGLWLPYGCVLAPTQLGQSK
jgi:hypothetical protein